MNCECNCECIIQRAITIILLLLLKIILTRLPESFKLDKRKARQLTFMAIKPSKTEFASTAECTSGMGEKREREGREGKEGKEEERKEGGKGRETHFHGSKAQ